MTKPIVYVIGGGTERMFSALSEVFEVVRERDLGDPAGWRSENGASVGRVANISHNVIDGALMDAFPNLGIISSYGVGYDTIDAVEAARRGIVVTHTPGVLNADVANTAILLMLAVSRRLLRDDDWARSGRWEKEGAAPLTRSIEGAKLGLLGMGRIGREIALRASAAFGCEIAYHTRSPKDVPHARHDTLEGLAGWADILTVIVPGGPATEKIVNAGVMNALGPEGMLINVGRGSVVDEDALVSALADGRLGSAGLDVFADEPRVPEALKSMENVVLLPHAGSATVETRAAMGDLTVNNLIAFEREGRALTPVPECRDL